MEKDEVLIKRSELSITTIDSKDLVRKVPETEEETFPLGNVPSSKHTYSLKEERETPLGRIEE